MDLLALFDFQTRNGQTMGHRPNPAPHLFYKFSETAMIVHVGTVNGCFHSMAAVSYSIRRLKYLQPGSLQKEFANSCFKPCIRIMLIVKIKWYRGVVHSIFQKQLFQASVLVYLVVYVSLNEHFSWSP